MMSDVEGSRARLVMHRKPRKKKCNQRKRKEKNRERARQKRRRLFGLTEDEPGPSSVGSNGNPGNQEEENEGTKRSADETVDLFNTATIKQEVQDSINDAAHEDHDALEFTEYESIPVQVGRHEEDETRNNGDSEMVPVTPEVERKPDLSALNLELAIGGSTTKSAGRKTMLATSNADRHSEADVYRNNSSGLKLSTYRNQRSPESVDKFRCQLCGKAFESNIELSSHMKEHGGGYKCSLCDKRFVRFRLMEDHALTEHSEAKSVSFWMHQGDCLEPESTVQPKNRSATVQVKKESEEVQRPKIKFNCHCRKSFLTKEAFCAHLRRHRNEIQCPKCSRTLPSLKQYENHNCGETRKRKRNQCDRKASEKASPCSSTVESKVAKRVGRPRRDARKKIKMLEPSELRAGLSDSESSVEPGTSSDSGMIMESEESSSSTKRQTKRPSYTLRPVRQPPSPPAPPPAKPKEPCICIICDQEFPSFSSLYLHQISHRVKGEVRCKLCDQSFPTIIKLKSHVRTHTSKDFDDSTDWECPVCDQVMPSKSALSTHEETHSINDYICKICVAPFSTRIEFINHKKSHRLNVVTCDKCGIELNGRNALLRHLQRKHPSAPEFRCEFCSVKFDTLEQLNSHKYEAHKEEIDWMNKFKPEEGKTERKSVITCKRCGVTVSKGHLKAHMAKFSCRYPQGIQCKECGMKIRSSLAKFRQHVQNHLDRKCIFCPNLDLANRKELMHHLAFQHVTPQGFVELNVAADAVKRFKCPKCDQSYTTSRAVKEHKILFHSKPSIDCPQCYEKFPTDYQLYAHAVLKHET